METGLASQRNAAQRDARAILATRFTALVLSHWARYLSGQAGIAVAIDSVMILLVASYLLANARACRKRSRHAERGNLKSEI